MDILVVGTDADARIFDELVLLSAQYDLPLTLSFKLLSKVNDKFILTTILDYPDSTIIAIIKNSPAIIWASDNGIMKSSLHWQALTKRIVNAGRKSELILQACKLNAQMTVIDGMAGFGHDGLILASTGVQLHMMERQPLMALLLFYEHGLMSGNQNWQKLLSCIHIHYGDFLLSELGLPKVDLVYLDPMFPADSYTAKVGKNMQVLHELAPPPSSDDERLLLTQAMRTAVCGGRVVVKRPISAPYLSGQIPAQSIANDAIRFDRYQVTTS
ncbi:class I SAM-dependent methyltransferase [Moraxella haemolytica]|uniref:class I SAM-dependent methyltransferase n=1 Tax=Moraxella haemolytica TaxID=2904119 RepID=UPI002543CFF4|nr:class I SAM-dependent methyltransferase [Moraxella sp. ZY171148]WII94485.1 class I SAM-dependent methyltransferase [Moraxella sp. ZY171148]